MPDQSKTTGPSGAGVRPSGESAGPDMGLRGGAGADAISGNGVRANPNALKPTGPMSRMTVPLDPHDRYLLMAKLRVEGWIICAPGCVPMPRNRREAEAMNLLSASYLKEHPV